MKKIITIFCCLLVSGCVFRTKKKSSPLSLDKNSTRPITIFIHGTLESFYSPYVHSFKLPPGLAQANDMPGKFSLSSRVPKILNKYHPEKYPLSDFYLFTWQGQLTFKDRKKAAQHLHNLLNGYKGKITIITHSHGGNVALNLAHFSKENPENQLKIDKLILLACPVQKVTEKFAKSDVFEKVYSLYSTSDMFQILDPQGVYKESKKIRDKGEYVPFLSERRLPRAPNTVQARIVLNKSNPKHINFLLCSFLKHLPDIIELLDTQEICKNCAINVPSRGKPYFVIPLTINSKYRMRKADVCAKKAE
ncbi:alpha/beta hydrolase [Candidatus Dependentiae bacterium]|nr:alpha/beta hydrolase [Candidatus Dependentiae bacterium]